MANSFRYSLYDGHTFNIYRKLWHMLGLIFPFALYFDFFSHFQIYFRFPTRAISVIILLFILFILITVDVIRLSNEKFNAFYWNLLLPLLKEGEQHKINATIPYFCANILLLLFFSKEIVVILSIFLIVSDPVAAFFGGHYGKNRFKNGKSIVGTLSFFLSGTLLGFLFLILHTVSSGENLALFSAAGIHWQVICLVIAGSICSAIAELFSSPVFGGLVDDNILIPIGGALGIVIPGIYIFGMDLQEIFFIPSV